MLFSLSSLTNCITFFTTFAPFIGVRADEDVKRERRLKTIKQRSTMLVIRRTRQTTEINITLIVRFISTPPTKSQP